MNLADRAADTICVGGAGLRDRRHFIIICDDADDIFRCQTLHEKGSSLTRSMELRSCHRARAVEHDRDVERRAVLRGRRVAFDLQQGAHDLPSMGVRLLVQQYLSLHQSPPYWVITNVPGPSDSELAA